MIEIIISQLSRLVIRLQLHVDQDYLTQQIKKKKKNFNSLLYIYPQIYIYLRVEIIPSPRVGFEIDPFPVWSQIIPQCA